MGRKKGKQRINKYSGDLHLYGKQANKEFIAQWPSLLQQARDNAYYRPSLTQNQVKSCDINSSNSCVNISKRGSFFEKPAELDEDRERIRSMFIADLPNTSTVTAQKLKLYRAKAKSYIQSHLTLRSRCDVGDSIRSLKSICNECVAKNMKHFDCQDLTVIYQSIEPSNVFLLSLYCCLHNTMDDLNIGICGQSMTQSLCLSCKITKEGVHTLLMAFHQSAHDEILSQSQALTYFESSFNKCVDRELDDVSTCSNDNSPDDACEIRESWEDSDMCLVSVQTNAISSFSQLKELTLCSCLFSLETLSLLVSQSPDLEVLHLHHLNLETRACNSSKLSCVMENSNADSSWDNINDYEDAQDRILLQFLLNRRVVSSATTLTLNDEDLFTDSVLKDNSIDCTRHCAFALSCLKISYCPWLTVESLALLIDNSQNICLLKCVWPNLRRIEVRGFLPYFLKDICDQQLVAFKLSELMLMYYEKCQIILDVLV